MDASMPFGGSREVYDWISRFINLERGQSVRSFRLDRMKAMADLAGRPETCAPSFHVAGSKGKGSVTGMIASILEASGLNAARYASPHVSDFRERILRGSAFFDEEIYARAGRELKALVEMLPGSTEAALFDSRGASGEEPTFFELMTLWFFLCARRARVDAMAVETGMGGRLDATNILDPLVSAITLIELEHTEFLGKTVAEIAGEKAGIVKPGRPFVLAEQPGDALGVFRKRADDAKSPLLYFPECAALRNVRVSREGTSFTLVLKNREMANAAADTGAFASAKSETFDGLFSPMPGEFQAANAGLAVLAVKTAYPEIPERAIREGLASFTLPARFERISDNPAVVIDGAHTGRSVGACLETFCGLYGSGGILIFGCAAGKDALAMAELCVPRFSQIIITAPGSFKKSFPEDIYGAFARESEKMKAAFAASSAPASENGAAASAGGVPPPVPEIILIPDTAEAIDKAARLALERNLPALGTGSFYLAGEIRDRLRRDPRRANGSF